MDRRNSDSVSVSDRERDSDSDRDRDSAALNVIRPGGPFFLAPGMVAGRGRSTQSHQRKDRPPFWHGRCCIQRQCRASELDGGGRGKARRMKALVSHHPYGLHLPHCFRSDGRMLPSQAAAHVQVCPAGLARGREHDNDSASDSECDRDRDCRHLSGRDSTT